GHLLQGPHRDLSSNCELPPGFAPLLLEIDISGQRLELIKPDVLVGRHSAADVRLAFPDVSRRHCRLVFQDGCWHVIDLSSMNGVYVNGEQLQEAALYEGDQLRVGSVTFVVLPCQNLDLEQRAILQSIVETLPSPRQAG